MKGPKLIDFLLQMQEIDDSFIDEALKKEEKNIKHTHRSKLSALVAAILSIVILVSITIVANDLMPLIIPEKATPYNPDNYALPEGALDENGQFTSEYLDYIERQQTGGFARSDWEHLTAEDYRTLDKNEEGVTYLEVANARQFVLDGTVIITDENGEPFKFIFNENDLSDFEKFRSENPDKIYRVSDFEMDNLGNVSDSSSRIGYYIIAER